MIPKLISANISLREGDKISSCNGSFDQVFNNIKLFYVESYICYVVLVYRKLFIESLYYLLIFGDGGSRFIETWFHGPIFMSLWLCQAS